MKPLDVQKAKLPPVAAAMTLDMSEMLDATLKLRDILLQETECLKQMKIAELATLHTEKQRLTSLLESYQTLLKANPKAIAALDEESREALAETMGEFTRIVDENYRRVAVARSINQRIMQTILDVVAENQHVGNYTKQGAATTPSVTLSFNLNASA